MGTLILWLPFIALIDYLNIYKTRVVLYVLSRQSHSAALLVVVLIVDFVVGLVIFHTLFALVFQLTEDIVMNPDMAGWLLIQIPSMIFYNFDPCMDGPPSSF